MPVIIIDGCELHYELLGEGEHVIALTPGGRVGGDAVRHIALALANEYRVLLWDRRNTGKSSVWFGEKSEQVVWADDLVAILERLDLGPAYLLGASAGARVCYLAAIRRPNLVRGMALWTVSGGPYACQVLGYVYHTPYIDAAIRGGMEAVADTPFFQERIGANVGNRQRLASMSPDEFLAVMRLWNRDFYYNASAPIICASDAQVRSIACPTLIIAGNDDVHTEQASLALHQRIAGSKLAPCAWTAEEWFAYASGRSPGTPMALYPKVLPDIFEFLAESVRARLSRN
jgi:2-hydroxy-6-oxonona-2,4-dienedioate hydrolase